MIYFMYIVQYFLTNEKTETEQKDILYSWLLLLFVSVFMIQYENVEKMCYSCLLLLFYVTALLINYSTFEFINFSICCQHAIIQNFPFTGIYNRSVVLVLSCFMFTYVQMKKSSSDDILLSIMFADGVYIIFSMLWKFI